MNIFGYDGFFDKFFNESLKRCLTVPNCVLIIGQKRAGKSTLSCALAQYYTRLGYTCFSNYPVYNCYPMPLQERVDKKNGQRFWMVDKNWLYNSDFTDCVLFIDEGANFWPARGFATDWTLRDTELFTMNAHHNTIFIINVQYLGLIDLNVRRAADYIVFCMKNRWFKSLTNIAVSEYVELPCAKKDTIIATKQRTFANKIDYELCEIPVGDFHLYRKPYYKLFDSNFDFRKYEKLQLDDSKMWQAEYDMLPEAIYQ